MFARFLCGLIFWQATIALFAFDNLNSLGMPIKQLIRWLWQCLLFLFYFYFYSFIYFNTTKQNLVMILAEYKNFGIEWQWRFWNWGVRWVGNQKIALPGVGTLGTTKFTSNTHTSIWKSSISCCSYCFRIYIGNHLRNFVDWTLRSNHTLLRSNVSYFCYKNSLSELDQPALEEFKALKAKIY